MLARTVSRCIVKNSTPAKRVDSVAEFERSDAGELAKIMDEMRLVEVSGVGCKLGPIHRQSVPNTPHQSVKSPHSAE